MPGLQTGTTIEQKQTLKLSPAQLQTIEILQMTSQQLEEKIRDELMENPVLETAEGHADPDADMHDKVSVEIGSSEPGDEIPHYDRYDDHDYWEMPSAGGAGDFEKFWHAEETLVDHLMRQLHGISCPDNVRRACRFVIYSLDDNGFLDMSPEELEEASENTAEEFVQAIPIVQSMNPAGIAARNLEECLRLQMDPDDELTEDASGVVGMLSEISAGNTRNVMKSLGITQERLLQVIEVIRKLDPKPGARFADGSSVKYISPDVIAEVHGEEAIIYMAGSMPRLTLSSYYTELARTAGDEEVGNYLRDRIERATRLIQNIEQRNNTIINVTRTILRHQSQFLIQGEAVLRPLTMQEVADELEINVSTVSRAVSGKYLKCPGGTYALRHFFTAEVSGGTRDSILGRIKELIAAEDPAHPLSDQKITDILTGEGLEISRRAVAKYRDSAGILPTSQRRKRF